MSKYTATQNNFSSGELSPTLEGRTDLREYANGVAKLENFIPSKEGGAIRRGGTIVKYFDTGTSNKGALFPFIDPLLSRFFMLEFDATAGIIMGKYSPLGGYTTAQDLDLDRGVSDTVSFSTRFKLLVSNNISSLDIRTFNYIQVYNAIIFTHPTGLLPPVILVQTSPGNFTLTEYLTYAATQGPEGRAVPFPEYTTRSGGDTVGFVTAAQITFGTLTTDDSMIGDYIRIKESASVEHVVRVDSVISASDLGVTKMTSNAGTPTGVTSWEWSSWSQDRGFPRSCSLYQQRVAFGGTAEDPSTIWFSNVENLFLMVTRRLYQDSSTDSSGLDFFGDVLASDPFTLTIASNTATTITWMNSDRVLQVGSLSAEYVISTVDGLFDANHAQASAQTFYGSRAVAPVRAQNDVIFITRDGKEMRGNRFSFENGSNVSRLLSVLSKEIVYHNRSETTGNRFDASFVTMAYQPSRSCVWALTDSGELVGCILEESSNTLAWHKHTIADAEEITGLVVLPSPDKEYDILYLNVKRTVNGATEYYIEAMIDDFGYSQKAGVSEYIQFLDCSGRTALLNNQASCPWLKGETVSIVADGEYVGDYECDATTGVIQVPDKANLSIDGFAVVGLKYSSKIKSMLVKAGSRTGDPQIQMSRIDSLAVNAYRSVGYKIGTSEESLEEVLLLEDETDVELYTGIKNTAVSSSGGREQRFYLEIDKPYPLTVLSVGVRGVTQD